MKKQLLFTVLWALVLHVVPSGGASAAPQTFLRGEGDTFGVSHEGLLSAEPVEVCSSGALRAHDRTFAELFKIKLQGVCSTEYVAAPAPPDIEICKFEGLGAFDFDMEFQNATAPRPLTVAQSLSSYKLNHLAIRSVERNVKVFSEVIRDRFAAWLARSGRYIRMMKRILREEGLPEDMAWLPLIESGFNTHAYSRSRASGPWQFIAGTGKRYGLIINWWVDERRDPVKSTRAAGRYLRDLHEIFGSWSLAMAAYNAGENKIERALRRTGGNDFWQLLKTGYIRRETKNYVPKFIAARLIAVEPERYGFDDIVYLDDFTYDEVTIESPLTLDVIARCAGTTVDVIKDLNPELRRWSTPPVEGYVLRVPRGARDKFLASLPRVPEGERFTVKVYRVRRGDTLSHISRRMGVPISAIVSYNKLKSTRHIRAGQKLLIPVGLKRI